ERRRSRSVTSPTRSASVPTNSSPSPMSGGCHNAPTSDESATTDAVTRETLRQLHFRGPKRSGLGDAHANAVADSHGVRCRVGKLETRSEDLPRNQVAVRLRPL